MPPVLTLAVCLFDKVAATDFQGPVELLGFISPKNLENKALALDPAWSIEASYLSTSLDPVQPMSGPHLVPTRTYASVSRDEQFDIILIPGGHGSRPGVTPEAVIDFIKAQAPGAKYVLAVCTGSEILARTGVLNGRRATTNKGSFNRIKGDNAAVDWVAKARWVVDGRLWTSSGVTAGTDMAYAFMEHLVGKEVSTTIRAIVELPLHAQDDDEFAEYYHLV